MKPSSGAPGSDRRVWFAFCSRIPPAVEAVGKWKSGGVRLISKRTGKVRSWDFSRERLFHQPAALRRAA